MTVFPKEILPKHLAIFGMTGSGKSTTARDLVEQVVPEGSRVCILDTVKSDWWGITSSADGKKPGLPFTILGGPHAHLPLSRTMGKAIGEVVASGALPLSIIDMADFGMGDASHFFCDLAQVLMRKMRGVLYLVIEEAHELAPKERVGFKSENMGVYWAKKLATAGRTKGLRLVVCSQRVQSLHNAVIGSCESMVVHRMTAPADQKPVVDWLKGNIKDLALRKEVEESMPSLPDGKGWLCSGAAKLFELIQFPRATTYDNTAAPTDDRDLKQVKTATIDTAALRAILADAVKEAESNDVGALKKRIAEMERETIKLRPHVDSKAGAPKAVPDPNVIKGLEAEAYNKGFAKGRAGWADYVRKASAALMEGAKSLSSLSIAMDREALTADVPPHNPLITPASMEEEGLGRSLTSVAHPRGNGKMPPSRLRPSSIETIEIDLPVPPVQQKILNALAEFEQMSSMEPRSELIAIMAGYTNVGSKGFKNSLSSLRSAGALQGLTLTDIGRAAARPSAAPATAAELQERIMVLLGGATARLLKPLIAAYPDAVDRQELAGLAGYGNLGSKGFKNGLSRLRSLGFIDYASPGTVIAQPVLFLE